MKYFESVCIGLSPYACILVLMNVITDANLSLCDWHQCICNLQTLYKVFASCIPGECSLLLLSNIMSNTSVVRSYGN